MKRIPYTPHIRVPAVLLAVVIALAVAVVTAATPSQAAEKHGAPCTSDAARACVDLSQRQAWLMNNGTVVYGPTPITTGRPGYQTAPGTFFVTFKDKDHVSSIYHAPMPYSVFFHGGQAFHAGSLATSSHGCIHLSYASAQEFYTYLHPGDEVVIHG